MRLVRNPGHAVQSLLSDGSTSQDLDQPQQRMPDLPDTYDQTEGIDVRGRLEIQGREDLPEEIREGAEEEEE